MNIFEKMFSYIWHGVSVVVLKRGCIKLDYIKVFEDRILMVVFLDVTEFELKNEEE